MSLLCPVAAIVITWKSFVMLGTILLVTPFLSKNSIAWVVVGALLVVIAFDSWGLITLTDIWQEIGDALDGLV